MNKYQQFVSEYGKFALNASKRFGILPEIILAVAAHETGFGSSYSAQFDKNFFGISASSFFDPQYWDGFSKRRTNDTAGYYRVYSSVQNSFYDFAWLLSNATRYAAVKRSFGNLEGFVAAFINSGYFTGNKTVYANALLNYAPELKKYIKQPFPAWLYMAGFGLLVVIKRSK